MKLFRRALFLYFAKKYMGCIRNASALSDAPLGTFLAEGRNTWIALSDLWAALAYAVLDG